FDESGHQFDTSINVGDFCAYQSTLLRPPVIAACLGGDTYLVGKVKHFIALDVAGFPSFAVVERYKPLPRGQQNVTGLFIVEPEFRPAVALVVIPVAAIEVKPHMIPFFQDQHEGQSGK
ncbi:hypothetical protein HDU79_000180, partial [Rhizoclosmatium sp. JEL0117]